METRSSKTNPAVHRVLAHVRSMFPEIIKVEYDNGGRWLYKDASNYAPNFHGRVDIDLLENAQSFLEGIEPITYIWED